MTARTIHFQFSLRFALTSQAKTLTLKPLNPKPYICSALGRLFEAQYKKGFLGFIADVLTHFQPSRNCIACSVV